MTEGKIQSPIIKYLSKFGYTFKVITANRDGIPDVITCINGQFIAFEIKAGKNNPTALQEWNRREIISNGGSSFVVRSLNEVKEIIKKIL